MSAAHPLEVGAIRARFPALERRQGGRAVAYFDGPGGTQVPREVVDAMAQYLWHHNANTHWNYPTSAETDAALDAARETLADFLHAEPAEVVFGLNMTTLTLHLARALGRRWGPGDEVVVTELEHHGNIAPWQALERERGITLRWVPFRPEDGTLDLEALAGVLGPRTRLLAVGAASNALGTVNDTARVCALAREAGAFALVDAVHSAPHLLPDVRATGCDFLVCSAYKFYGPHIGILWGRRRLLEALDVPKVQPAPDTAPERLETGTQNHEGIVGAAAAVSFLASLAPGLTRREALAASYQAQRERSERLFGRLWEGLGAISGVRRFGPPPHLPRTPTLGFVVEGMPSGQVARRLAAEGLFLSHGDFYAATVVERLGLAPEGLVRAGCACYTSDDEIERLIAAVAALAPD